MTTFSFPSPNGQMPARLETTVGQCPLCGGQVIPGLVAIPFLLKGTVITIRNVPTDFCAGCGEPFLTGEVTDEVMHLLNGSQASSA
jgi:YgiT-type zinc finger domain-containing protein